MPVLRLQATPTLFPAVTSAVTPRYRFASARATHYLSAIPRPTSFFGHSTLVSTHSCCEKDFRLRDRPSTGCILILHTTHTICLLRRIPLSYAVHGFALFLVLTSHARSRSGTSSSRCRYIHFDLSACRRFSTAYFPHSLPTFVLPTRCEEVVVYDLLHCLPPTHCVTHFTLTGLPFLLPVYLYQATAFVLVGHTVRV